LFNNLNSKQYETNISSDLFNYFFVVITKQDLLSQDWSLNGNNLTGNEKLGSLNKTDLKIFTDNKRRVTIKANGKVGIGITNPAYKLDVNGSLNLAFDSGVRSGGAKILTAFFTGGNLFIGYHAGDTNQYVNVYQGANNTFVGQNAGRSNTYGTLNSYFGNGAGYYTTGSCNTFAGTGAGVYAYTGSHNTFVGYSAGLQTSYGSYNCFLGDSAGWRNYGDDNVYIGHLATAPHYATLTNSAAIGSHAAVTASNSMMFGNNAVNFWGFGLTTPVAGQALVVGSSASNGKWGISYYGRCVDRHF
jgi:hypothetical protein